MALSFSFAVWFWSFQFGVRERLPWRASGRRGFSLGKVRLSRVSASWAHSWGVQQSLFRSSRQSWHWQYMEGQCGFSLSGALRCADTWIRSAMVFARCLWRRHLVALFLIGRGSDPRWYHVGSCVFRWVLSLMAARLTLCTRAVFSILDVSSSSWVAQFPLCGGFQVCRKQLMRVWALVPWGMVASMIRSMIFAQVGRDGEKSR
jgi:hypothetical protein